MIALGVSLASVPIWANGVSFSPLSLFAASEPGAWLDPSDLSTLFQDAAGTTPVTAPGQSVGLVLDKSKGLVLGPDIETDNWSTPPSGVTYSAGMFTFDGVTSQTNTVFSTNTPSTAVVVGRTYKVSFTIFQNTTLPVGVNVGGVIGDAQTNPGTYTRLITATSTAGPQVAFRNNVGLRTGAMGNISVRELAGNHATQATAAARPTYGIVPRTGRRNLAIGSGDVGNATFWPNTTTQNGITATKVGSGFDTDGLPYVDVRYQGTATSTFHTTAYAGDQSRTSSGAVAWSSSFIARVVGGSTAGVSGIRASVREETAPSTFIGITDGNAVTAATDTQTLATRTLSTGNQASVLVSLNFTNGATIDVTYRIKALQFELGSTRTTYQRVVSQFDVTEAGVPSLHYLSFDGVDDFLVTPTITPGTDKVQVFAGLRKLSDAAIGTVVELTAAGDANNGGMYLRAPTSIGGANYQATSRGTINSATTATGFAAPITNVVTFEGDIPGDRSALRINQTAFPPSVADQGTGDYSAAQMWIGRRGGTSLPFNGHIYGLITRFGANLTADQITKTETWMNSKTGAF